MELHISPTKKQRTAYSYLKDSTTEEIVYGGAAGGGKSWLGCEWLLGMALQYPGTRWFVGREELNDLRVHNKETVFKVLQHHGINANAHLRFNAQDNIFRFRNGSSIKYIELKYLPSDPMFQRLGSTEFTGGWIEEAGEINHMAYDILKVRIGRWYNDHYNLTKKMLVTCNPAKNWLYHIYKRNKEKNLPEHIQFIQALVSDNTYIEKQYRNSLTRMENTDMKERLLYGNWEYSNDPSCLMKYETITDVFKNRHVPIGEMAITADVARFGKDTTVIMVWSGFRVESIYTYEKAGIDETAEEIRGLMNEYSVPASRVVVDEDGVGGGVKDILNCRGFINNSRAQEVRGEKENYNNLKSQCYFRLAARINSGGLYINCRLPNIKEKIVEELEQVKRNNMDKDGNLSVVPKETVKEKIGRSPDYSDTLMMREYLEIIPSGKVRIRF